MELSKILLDTAALPKWVAKDFISSTPSKFNKIHHVLSSENFNRIIKDRATPYQIFGFDIDSIFVYNRGKQDFCTYLILDLNQHDLDLFIKEFGMPLNVSAADFFSGDYDFLNWKSNSFEIFLTRNYSDEYSKNSCKVTITNIPLKETLDDRTIK